MSTNPAESQQTPTVDFSASASSARGRDDASNNLSFPTTGVPVYLSQGKRYFESQIEAIDAEVVNSAVRTQHIRAGVENELEPIAYSTKVVGATKYRDERLAKAEVDRDELLDQEKARKYDPMPDQQRVQNAKDEFEVLERRFGEVSSVWMQVRNAKPSVKPFAKWFLVVLLSAGEVFINMDWLGGLITTDSPIPGVPVSVFIAVLAFIVSFAIMWLGETSGASLRQRDYVQVVWKLTVCFVSGGFISFYREYNLEKQEIAQWNGEGVKPILEMNPYVVGVSLALFLLLLGLSVSIGYASSYGYANYQTAKTDFESMESDLKAEREKLKQLQEQLISGPERFQMQQSTRIDKINQEYIKEVARVKQDFDFEVQTAAESRKYMEVFASAFVNARQRVSTVSENFQTFVAAYVSSFGEISGQVVTLPEGWDHLKVPERLLQDNPDPKDFIAANFTE